ncbi:conserved protein of unknown function [Petrocella atlantisensis]|uniref:Uncharacterized protein n=1 Tax=Petrocella atlantisensis TaxID=2173034 RepID=A0A3P7RYS6_9FIRM|nr:hypothetical protein [Petrocella atlantisensis]VDN45929.1 conserved protein of unknown function [Petrocella atlantisensis]
MNQGTQGYINQSKHISLKWALIGVLSFMMVYLAGILIMGSQKSYFTIVAVLLILPTAQRASQYFAYSPYKSVSTDLVDALSLQTYKALFELLIIRAKATYFLDAVLMSDTHVLILCLPNKKYKQDHNVIRQSIQHMLKDKGIQVTVLSYDKISDMMDVLKTLENESEITNSKYIESIERALLQNGM